MRAVIPPFIQAIDRAVSYLEQEGIMGVTDFYVSGKYDLPMRQMGWLRRFFWRWAACAVCTWLMWTTLDMYVYVTVSPCAK